MSLKAFQNLPDAGVRFFNHEEEKRIMAYPLPGRRRWNSHYYPRRPVEDPREWFREHAEKLRSLERAAKY